MLNQTYPHVEYIGSTVVAFEIGGMNDTIQLQRNGYLARESYQEMAKKSGFVNGLGYLEAKVRTFVYESLAPFSILCIIDWSVSGKER